MSARQERDDRSFRGREPLDPRDAAALLIAIVVVLLLSAYAIVALYRDDKVLIDKILPLLLTLIPVVVTWAGLGVNKRRRRRRATDEHTAQAQAKDPRSELPARAQAEDPRSELPASEE
jgi:hypothetical protein